jgi:hypothetical protein
VSPLGEKVPWDENHGFSSKRSIQRPSELLLFMQSGYLASQL